MPSVELDSTAGPRPPHHSPAAPPVAALPEARAPWRLGLRAALTGLVLLTVMVTAVVIHLTWFYAARRNVADVVGQLNRQIVGSVQHEVRGTLNDAWSMQEADRSSFKRRSSRQTRPSANSSFSPCCDRTQTLSWIALGFPDGAFFGALKAGDDEIDMVEVKQNAETGIRQQRVDAYTPAPGDVIFRGREVTPSDFEATAQPWYERAVTEDGPAWSMLSHLPYRDRPAIVTSTPIVINLDFAGVVAVVVELERLSQFLAGLQVGKTGTVVLLDRNGQVVASSNGWNGKPVPGLAPAAKQQGRYVASVIEARTEGRPRVGPFRYRHAGSLATIGRKAAVADFGWLRSRALWPGGSGAWSTSCSCQGCAIEL